MKFQIFFSHALDLLYVLSEVSTGWNTNGHTCFTLCFGSLD